MRGNIFWLIPLAAILIWPMIAMFSIWTRSRIRELEIRERIAMIEKGLVPPPERDPEAFDRAMHRYDRDYHDRGPGRHRRAGIILLGVGFGFMVMTGFERALRGGFGIGGFLIMLGLAFLVSHMFERPYEPPRSGPPRPPSPPSSGPVQQS